MHKQWFLERIILQQNFVSSNIVTFITQTQTQIKALKRVYVILMFVINIHSHVYVRVKCIEYLYFTK